MIYQRSYDKFINGGCTGNADFLYVKDTYSNYVISAKINAYWKQQCILYKRCLSTTVVQLICNQQVVGSNPTGS